MAKYEEDEYQSVKEHIIKTLYGKKAFRKGYANGRYLVKKPRMVQNYFKARVMEYGRPSLFNGHSREIR